MPSELLTETRSKLLDIKNRIAVLDPLVDKALLVIRDKNLLVPDNEVDGESFLSGADSSDEGTAADSQESGDETPPDARRSGTRASHIPKLGNSTEVLIDYTRRSGIGAQILKLTKILNGTSMDDTSRVLLSTPGVYETILLRLFRDDKAEPKDVDGLVQAVLVAVQDVPRSDFYAEILKGFRSANRLSIDTNGRLFKRFLNELLKRGVPLAAGKTVTMMRRIFEEIRAEGDLRVFVDQFARRGEIDPIRFTTFVKQSMVDYLDAIGIQHIDDAKFGRGGYDEYFAQAYHQAIFAGDGSPPKNVIVQAAANEFRLPTYDYVDDQGVVPASIHAAAVLYQIFMIGDKLGMLEMPNALLARRARGKLDLPSGTASTQLQNYKRFQRAEDVQPEERKLIYKRVFNLGGGDVLEDTVVNEEFQPIWDSLMKEVTNFITKDEMSNALEDRVSRSAIKEAIRNLQVNLSFYGADIDEDVRVMKKQYELAESILRNSDIMASIGLVRRQTLQAAIERLVANDAGSVPMVKAMFMLGTKGQEILHFVAEFDDSTPDEEFQRFLKLAESWIISRASIQSEDFGKSDSPDDSTDDEDDSGQQAKMDDWEN